MAAALAFVALGLFVASAALAFNGPARPSQTARLVPPPTTASADLVTAAARSDAVTAPIPKQMARPFRLLVPAIGVNAPVIPLGRNSDGSLQVPSTTYQTGWFKPGPEPGETGAAVIAGHVDSRSGPGVFYRLPALRRGDRIVVRLMNGSRVVFAVTGMKQVAKNRFPTKLVYSRGSRRGLRLITCGGSFNSATGHYVDNIVVFAAFVAWRR